MVEFVAQYGWRLAAILLTAGTLVLAQRIIANLSFDLGYRKGWLDNGYILGLALGLPGAVVAGFLPQLPAPNIANEAQLAKRQVQPGAANWYFGQNHILLGWLLAYWQLVVLFLIRTPQLYTPWLWLAPVALLAAGVRAMLAAGPPLEQLEPVGGVEVDEPEDLLEFLEKRSAWARSLARLNTLYTLHAALTDLVPLTGLFAVITLALRPRFVITPLAIALSAAFIALFILRAIVARRLNEAEESQSRDALEQAETEKQRELLQKGYELVSKVSEFRRDVGQAQRQGCSPSGLGFILLIGGFFTGMWWKAVIGALILLFGGFATSRARQMMEDLERRARELDELDEECSNLAREVEDEALDQALDVYQRQASKYLRETYIQSGPFEISWKLSMPQELWRRQAEKQLDDADREQLRLERERNESIAMQYQFLRMQQLWGVLQLRRACLLTSLVLAGLVLALWQFDAVSRLQHELGTAILLGLGLSVVLTLPANYDILRNRAIWLGLVLAVALVMLFRACSSLMPEL